MTKPLHVTTNKQTELLNANKDKINPAITILHNEVGGEGEIVNESGENVRECMNNRNISLIPHASKILLRNVLK
jgi:hypothetical protein